MIRKLMICPYFGPLPNWWPLYEANVGRLVEHGYHWLVDTDLAEFKRRVRDRLGVDAPLVEGGAKIHDYRATFGVLYEHELAGYDFWGHTDFDCVYGRVENLYPDSLLAELDVAADHSYVLGPWTLYRNLPAVNELFYAAADWREQLETEAVTGWVETGFTDLVKASGLQTLWTSRHVYEPRDLERLRWDNGCLMLGEREVPFCHFKRTKAWPEALA